MAGVDNICLDKTGVITKNAHKVTNLWCGNDIDLMIEPVDDGKSLANVPFSWADLVKD